MRKTTRLIAVLSAAAMMAVAAPNVMADSFLMEAYAAGTGWVQEDDGWHFYDEDGYMESNTWKKRGSDWFYLDDNGDVTVNERVDEYFVDSEGKMVKNKWVTPEEEEETYDSPDSASAAEWNYFDKNGKIVTSRWMSINGNSYYFDEDGRMQTGLLELDGHTYYLGAENDGAMKTGWILLEDITEDTDDEGIWCYFDEDGRLVENQTDRKIDGSYYTFANGQMQTGWVNVGNGSETGAASDGTDSADSKAISLADYKYYDEEQGGKRASGWRLIEGVEGLSDEGEEYYFYFKNGRPYYSETGSPELFNINSERYAFNDRGEMQTDLQKLVTKDGTEATYYFGEDGAMKTGKQTIYDEDLEENQTWYFYPSGSKKGQGYTGEKDNRVYVDGLMKKADPELRYEPVEAGGRTYLVNTSGTIQKSSSSSVSDAKPELGKGFKDYKDSNETVWTVDTNGIIQ